MPSLLNFRDDTLLHSSFRVGIRNQLHYWPRVVSICGGGLSRHRLPPCLAFSVLEDAAAIDTMEECLTFDVDAWLGPGSYALTFILYSQSQLLMLPSRSRVCLDEVYVLSCGGIDAHGRDTARPGHLPWHQQILVMITAMPSVVHSFRWCL